MSYYYQLRYGFCLLISTHIIVGSLIMLLGGIITYVTGVFGLDTSNTIGSVIVFIFLGIGIFQLIYVVPIVIKLRREQEWEKIKGVILGATITALLNGGCWLFIIKI